jgi:hypothetical protein
VGRAGRGFFGGGKNGLPESGFNRHHQKKAFFGSGVIPGFQKTSASF